MRSIREFIENKLGIVDIKVFRLKQGNYVEIPFKDSYCMAEGHREEDLLEASDNFEKVQKLFPTAYVEIDYELPKSMVKKIKNIPYDTVVFVEYEDEYDEFYLIIK